MATSIWPPCEALAVRHACTKVLTLHSSVLVNSRATSHLQRIEADTILEAVVALFTSCCACNCLSVCVCEFRILVGKMTAAIRPIGNLYTALGPPAAADTIIDCALRLHFHSYQLSFLHHLPRPLWHPIPPPWQKYSYPSSSFSFWKSLTNSAVSFPTRMI